MPFLSKTITYRVDFVCYRHNCGGQMMNGNQHCSQTFKFNELDAAKDFADQVKKFAKKGAHDIPEGSNNFASAYVHDGYVEFYVGLYRVTTEKID